MRASALFLILALAWAKESVHDLSVGEEQGAGSRARVVEATHQARPRPNKYAKWTKGVDSQIAMGQAELAEAHVRSKNAEDAMATLQKKQSEELKALRAEMKAHPDQKHLSEEDINRSYAHLIEHERQAVEDQRHMIAKVSAYLSKLEEARRKIVTSAMSFAAVTKVEHMKRNQEEKLKRKLYNQLRSQDEKNFINWSKDQELAVMVKHAQEWEKERAALNTAEEKKAFDASNEVKLKVKNSGTSEAHKVAGIAERIRMRSDDAIRAETQKIDSKHGKTIEKFQKAQAKSKSQLKRLRSESMEAPKKPDEETEEMKQERANTEAEIKLKMADAKKKEQPEQEPEKDYKSEYEAYKMSLTAERNETVAAKMAEMNERVKQLQDWNKDHEEQEQAHLKSFLSKVEETDKKETELNNLYVQANEKSEKKRVLEKIEKLHHQVQDLKMRKDARKAEEEEAPLPEVPGEYLAPVNSRGKRVIAKSPVVASLHAQIHQKRAELGKIKVPPKPENIHPLTLDDPFEHIHAVVEGMNIADEGTHGTRSDE